jgi:hypothetical protein
MAFKMFPLSACFNAGYSACCDSEHGSNVFLHHATAFDKPNYNSSSHFGDNGVFMVFPAWASMASLRHHICNIFSVCTKKQMARIDAFPIVTLMQYAHSVRDDAVMDKPRKSMSFLESFIHQYFAIPVPVTACGPLPAFRMSAPINFGPKSLFKYFHRNIVAQEKGYYNG